MGITVPVNVQSTLDTTASKSMFLNVPKDGALRVRFLPTVDGSEGSLFALTSSHFRLKAEDGEKGIAVGCNKLHSPGQECILCKVQEFLANSDDPLEKAVGDSRESIRASNNWYAQVLPAIPQDNKKFTYGELKLLRLPKTGATKVGKLLKVQHAAGEDFFTDENEGRDVMLTREDTGVQFTQYDAMVVGKPSALNDIRPSWESEIFSWPALWDALDVKIMSPEEQKACLMVSYPAFDWKAIFKGAGVE